MHDLVDCKNHHGKIDITNAVMYGANFALMASGYPMRTDLPEEDFRPAFANDVDRANKLAHSPIGSGHDNFLNGIILQFDLTAPIKMWTELQRYHFMDFVSSQSTMHRLARMDLDMVFDDSVSPRVKTIMKDLQAIYNADPTEENWLKMMMSCPVGLKLTARMTTNYRQLKTIYLQRKLHKLPHWREFCEWLEDLPLSEFFMNGA
jgi:hypothetical protein